MKKGTITLIIITLLTLVIAIVGPVVYSLLTNHGTSTGQINTSGASPATEDINGTWTLIPGTSTNKTAVGYTIDEVLPGQHKTTAGRAYLTQDNNNISSTLKISDQSLQSAELRADLRTISSDEQKRDYNVRRKILETDRYPDADFVLTSPVNLAQIPADGTVGTVSITGDLTLHGQHHSVTTRLTVLRTGNRLIVEGHVPFNRNDYGITSPEFVAAKIADEGTIDLLLVFEKQ